MARTMIHAADGRPALSARKRAAILDRMERQDERDIRAMLARLAGTDTATLRRELAS